MPQKFKKRTSSIEKEVSTLRAKILNLKSQKKNWRSTIGTLPYDKITIEAEKLGRKYREQQTYENEIARRA
jgi:hypothetical protein